MMSNDFDYSPDFRDDSLSPKLGPYSPALIPGIRNSTLDNPYRDTS